MARLPDMRKAKEKIDNTWVLAGLVATGKQKKDLAELLEIDAAGVSRLFNLKKPRALKDFESNQIKDWFLESGYTVPEKSLAGDTILTPTPNNKRKPTKAEGAQEEGPMSDKTLMKFIELLLDDVKDLKADVRKLTQGPGSANVRSRKRRKNP